MLLSITAHVLRDQVPPEDVPLTLKAGDQVRVGHPHPDRPNYFWAEDGGISAGWVPGDLLEQRGGALKMREDYCSAELAVTAGETVRLLWQDTAHDSWWCESHDSERGWVPADNLSIDAPVE